MIEKAITKFRDAWKKDGVIYCFYLIAVLVVYWRTVSVGFFSDDYHMLSVFSSNPSVFRFVFGNIVGEFGGGSYGPVFALFHYAEYKLFGLNAWPYHLVSLFLHSANAFLVYTLVKILTKRRYLAVISGFVFALAAHQVFAIVWIAVLPHLLATFLALLSICFFIRQIGNPGHRDYLISLLFFILSICTKENAIFLPLILGLYFVFLSEHNIKRRVVLVFFKISPFVVSAAIFFLARYSVTSSTVGFYAQASTGLDWAHYRSMFFDLFADFFVDYPRRVVWHDWLVQNWFWGGVLLLPFAVVWFAWREKWRTSLGFFLSLLISLVAFLPLSLSRWNDGGERYTYYISVFFWPYIILTIDAVLMNARIWRTKLSWGKFFSICLLLFFLVVNILKIFPKQNRWIASGQRVKTMLASVDEIDFNDKYTVFVGLPDNLDGAEVIRNAIKEAIKIETGVQVIGERIPLYSVLGSEADAFSFVSNGKTGQIAGQVVFTPSAGIHFTGFKEYSRPFADFSLIGYVKPDMGQKIAIVGKRDKFWYDGRYLPLQYVFFDGKKLVKIDE